ncbi:MAG: hypothetical protein JWM48_63 [Mycobacterium sp.]|nr:hypothetical protein [Mycobacterium sp.]
MTDRTLSPLAARAALPLAWAVTRLGLLVAPALIGASYHRQITSDVRLYDRWAGVITAGGWPRHDLKWQYPPAVGGLLALPRLGPSSLGYLVCFDLLMLLVDGLIVLLLLRAGARRPDGPSRAGAWFWVVGLVCVGPIALQRFDLVPAALAVAGLLVAGRVATGRRAALAGALLGLGALVKVWPGLLLIAVRGAAARRTRASVAAVLGAAAAGLAVLAGVAASGHLGASFSFLGHEKHRGLQIEAPLAWPFLLAHEFGSGYVIEFRYGAAEVLGPGVGAMLAVSSALTALGLATVALLEVRARLRRGPAGPGSAEPAVMALAVLLVATVFSRVVSPQYLVWLVALAALVWAVTPELSRSLRTALLLLAVAALLGQEFYPLGYAGLRTGAVLQTAVLGLRNVLLLAATALVVRAAWRGSPVHPFGPSGLNSGGSGPTVDEGTPTAAPLAPAAQEPAT